MKQEDLIKVLAALSECIVDVENRGWGPAYSLAHERRATAIQILRTEIKRLQGL
jgi:hypothetical protein